MATMTKTYTFNVFFSLLLDNAISLLNFDSTFCSLLRNMSHEQQAFILTLLFFRLEFLFSRIHYRRFLVSGTNFFSVFQSAIHFFLFTPWNAKVDRNRSLCIQLEWLFFVANISHSKEAFWIPTQQFLIQWWFVATSANFAVQYLDYVLVFHSFLYSYEIDHLKLLFAKLLQGRSSNILDYQKRNSYCIWGSWGQCSGKDQLSHQMAIMVQVVQTFNCFRLYGWGHGQNHQAFLYIDFCWNFRVIKSFGSAWSESVSKTRFPDACFPPASSVHVGNETFNNYVAMQMTVDAYAWL